MAVDAASRRLVRRRAGARCEYCQLPQESLPFATFHVEHIIARQHGGPDSDDNLCLSCHWCNFNKGSNIATLEAGQLTPLCNPRTDSWLEHFELRGDVIVGLTATGRATVQLLNMNDEDRQLLRGESASKR